MYWPVITRCLLLLLLVLGLSAPLLAQAPDDDDTTVASKTAAAPVPAVTATEPALIRQGSVVTNPQTFILSLLAVLALIFLLAWLFRRSGALSLIGQPLIKPLATLSLGPKEKLVLIELADKQYLLGVTAQQITTIDSYDPPLSIPVQGNRDFASRFSQAIRQQQDTK